MTKAVKGDLHYVFPKEIAVLNSDENNRMVSNRKYNNYIKKKK